MTRTWQARLRRLASEPLLHFTVLGGLVFVLYSALHAEQSQARVIVLEAFQRRELEIMFEQRHHRVPVDSEMNDMIERWVVSELLFRKGIELDLDRQDTTIREMVISKARAAIQSRLVVSEPTEDELKSYFERNRKRYEQPAMRAISQIVVGPGEHDGDALAANVREALVRGVVVDRPLMTQAARPAEYYELVFGPAFSEALFELPVDGWHIISSRRGHHIVHIDAHQKSVPQPLSAIRKRVLLDMQNEQKKLRYQEALTEMRRDYEIRLSEDPS